MLRSEIDLILENTPRSKMSKKLVAGVGINDSTFTTQAIIEGKSYKHRAYDAWREMLRRCYDVSIHFQYPQYKNVKVCEEWLSFTSFYNWWKNNYKEGYQLDKDLLISNNKMYSPESCIYVPNWLNNFLSNCQNVNCSFITSIQKYRVQISVKGKQKFIGNFLDKQEAILAWRSAKLETLDEFYDVCQSIHPLLYQSLRNKIIESS